MKMYKIIPSTQSVEEIEYNGEYSGMHPHLKYLDLGHARLNAEGDELFLNDEGLLDGTREKDGSWWWQYKNGQWQEFVGDCLLWGTKGEDNADPSMTIPELSAKINWEKPAGVEPTVPRTEFISFDSLDDMIDYLNNNPPAWR